MTLLHIEGFDVIDSTAKSSLVGIDMSHSVSANTTLDVTGRYTGSTSLQLDHKKVTFVVSDEDGTDYYPGNRGTWSRIPFAEQQALGSFTFGFAFKTSAINDSYETVIASIADSSGNPLLLLSHNTSGYLKAYLPDNSEATYSQTFRTSYASSPTSSSSGSSNRRQRYFVQDEYLSALGTGSTVLAVDTWYTIECQIVENSSKNYSLELRLDDVVEIDSDNNAVSNNQCANLHEVILLNSWLIDHASNFSQDADGENNHFFDDFYFLDDAGSNNTSFLGADMRVQGLALGTANTGIDHNFSVTSGTVGANLADFDTTTIATLANPGIGVFDIANPETVNTGNGIRYIVTAKFATGATNLEFLSRIGSTNYEVSGTIHGGTALALSSSFNTFQEIQELNPATSAAFDESTLDAIQVGLKAS